MKKNILALIVSALFCAGFALAQGATPAGSAAAADVRKDVFELLRSTADVRDSESWSRWIRQWEAIVRRHGGDADLLAFGQIVGVPGHPAARRYTDWERVPYPARPSVALAHACGLMTGRVTAGGTLEWAPRAPLQRFEAANIAARSVELMFELIVTGAVYSRPGCPLALGAFHGDPEIVKDLLDRQEARHAAAIKELRAALEKLQALDGLPAEMRAKLEAELRARIEFQRGIKSSIAELERKLVSRIEKLERRVSALESRPAAAAPAAPAAPAPAPRADWAPVWINWTGPDGREFRPSNPYRGGEVSVNLGLNAGPEAAGWSIVSVSVPTDGVRANDGQEGWKRSFWFSHLDPSRVHTASITVRGPSGQTITVSHILGR